MNKKMTTLRLCMIAMAVCINVAGGQLALMLRLPIYLDSIGTILIGAWMGPFYGMLPNMISGVLMGFTTDIYSLYFAPVGMITGFMAGIAAKQMHGLVFEKQVKKLQIIIGALFIWRCNFLWLQHSGTDFIQNTAWPDRKYFRRSDFYRLLRQSYFPCPGSHGAADAAIQHENCIPESRKKIGATKVR